MWRLRAVEILGCSPEWLVLRTVVGALLAGQTVIMAPTKPRARVRSSSLMAPGMSVDVDHGDALEPLRSGLAKFRDPVIIDPKDDGEQVLSGTP